MSQFVKKYWLPTVLSFLVVSIIIGWFYWFQYRPSRIRALCNALVRQKMTDKNSTYEFVKEYYDLDFQDCLNKYGLRY